MPISIPVPWRLLSTDLLLWPECIVAAVLLMTYSVKTDNAPLSMSRGVQWVALWGFKQGRTLKYVHPV